MRKNLVVKMVCLFLITVILGSAIFAKKEVYPSKTVQVIVPVTTGGITDLQVRAMGPFFKKYMGQELVSICKPGGAGIIGTTEYLTAKPDGYTLGCVYTGPISIQPLYGQTAYKANDFDLICQFSFDPIVVMVKGDSPIKTYEDFVEFGKKNTIKYASVPAGVLDISMEIFCRENNIKSKNMPVEGGVPAITALLGGHVDAAVVHPAVILSYVKSGDLRPIVVFENERLDFLPKTVTAKEKGINVVASVWKGIAVAKGAPVNVRKRLEQGFKKICTDPNYIKAMQDMNVTPKYLGSKQLTEKVKKEVAMYERYIKSKGLGKQ